jgi:hypothetical protein
VRRLVQHGSEAEKLAHRRLIHHHFLLVLIHRGHAHAAGHHDVAAPADFAGFVNALPRRKRLQLHLARQHRNLVVIEQCK